MVLATTVLTPYLIRAVFSRGKPSSGRPEPDPDEGAGATPG